MTALNHSTVGTRAGRSKVWLEPGDLKVPASLVALVGNPLLAKILTRRGFDSVDAARGFLDPDAYNPAPPGQLPDLSIAASQLHNAIRNGRNILVWGDFDVDGQTATALLYSALGDLGATVRAYIPNRLREGHGIGLTALQKQLVGIDVLLTCDTGVNDHEAIVYARGQNVTVLITDHHDLPEELPPADAIVNAKRVGAEHPLRELPGVGVAYKLIEKLYQLSGASSQQLSSLLDLVALGIVADVAVQTGDTRYLLQRGMACLRDTRRVGLLSMMQLAQLNPDQLATEHIGFSLGPRLNALGRLGDANLAVELLTTSDYGRARILAAQLEGLNERRRLLTEQVYSAAQQQIAQDSTLLDMPALVVSGPRWHAGVIGIVASRLSEYYDRPTVLISEGDDGLATGSARSVPGFDVHAAINAVGHLLKQHGGHPGAAGLRLSVERISEFRRAFARAVDQMRDPGVRQTLSVDAVVNWNELSREMAAGLNTLAPFGAGNASVVLASRNLDLVSQRVFGRNAAHRRLKLRDLAESEQEVIWWRGAEYPPPTGRFDLAYELKTSDYRGEPALQIEYVDARVVKETPAILDVPAVTVLDHRGEPDSIVRLRELKAAGDVVVWAEGYRHDDSPGLRRDQLTPASSLVIWTPPPGRRELQNVIELVRPSTVHLFDVQGDATFWPHFLRRLTGLIRTTLSHKGGVASLEPLAAASAQRMEAVREGIYLLDARGDVRIQKDGETTLTLIEGDSIERPGISFFQARLEAVLQETAAFRTYYRRAPADRLI